MNLYLALVHHPIKNKNGELITTAVTNMDIHDIGRSCRTFGVENYFIVTPIKPQHELVGRILGHWEQDKSAAYNPDRQDALSITRLVDSVEDAIAQIIENTGKKPILVATGANFTEFNLLAENLCDELKIDEVPVLLLFGTGWGLHSQILEKVDYCLKPIRGYSDYNHLSVRSAVAIYLDRIVSRKKLSNKSY
jgi:hypothetical protein